MAEWFNLLGGARPSGGASPFDFNGFDGPLAAAGSLLGLPALAPGPGPSLFDAAGTGRRRSPLLDLAASVLALNTPVPRAGQGGTANATPTTGRANPFTAGASVGAPAAGGATADVEHVVAGQVSAAAPWRGDVERIARRVATEYGLDPGVLADVGMAVMAIESGGNVRATSPVGASGLMQVMPFHFTAGEDPYDPETNVARGLAILAQNARTWGTWDQAAAAYFGAIDSRGNILGGASDGGATGDDYLARFRTAYDLTTRNRPGAGTAPAWGSGGATR